MDLSKFRLSKEDIDEARRHLFYQPFKISDDVQSGVAYDWAYGKGIFQADKRLVDPETWAAFDHLNEQLRITYDYWLRSIAKSYGDMSAALVVDTACAEGYFLYGLLGHGAGRCIGYDISDRMAGAIGFLNRVTERHVEFRNIPYDMRQHKISGAPLADIVISSAIMVHLSDPTFYLEFLGSITQKVLFLYSAFEESDEFRITHEFPRMHHDNDAKFPLCFSGRTTISTGLLKFALADLGFNQVIELPPIVSLPIEGHRAFIAIK